MPASGVWATGRTRHYHSTFLHTDPNPAFMRFRLPLLALLAASVPLLACKSPDTARQDSRAGDVVADTGRALDSALIEAADLGRIQGAAAAPVWLLVISDFQCPYCRMWHEQTWPAIEREYVQPGRVRVAYINLPLSNHQHALPAAEAAMCAGVQGKFWQVADGIFDTQERWTPLRDASAVYDSIATAAGVDVPRWRECVAQHRTVPMINADAARAGAIGVQSTPSFVVMRGQEVVRGIAGAYPIETFREALDTALAGAGQAPRR